MDINLHQIFNPVDLEQSIVLATFCVDFSSWRSFIIFPIISSEISQIGGML